MLTSIRSTLGSVRTRPVKDVLALWAAASIRRWPPHSTTRPVGGGAAYTARRSCAQTGRQGAQRKAASASMGKAEARTRSCAWRNCGPVAGGAIMGRGVRRRAARNGAAVGLRGRVAQDRAQVLARDSRRRLLVELLRPRKRPEGRNHRERQGWRPAPPGGVHLSELTATTGCTMRNLRNARRL